MHTVVWRNKYDFDTMSVDNFYNNLKVCESEMKVTSASSSATQNLAFLSSNSKGFQETHSATYGVSTSGNNDYIVRCNRSENVSDATIFALLADFTTNTQVLNQDMEHIDPNDLEEIELKW